MLIQCSKDFCRLVPAGHRETTELMACSTVLHTDIVAVEIGENSVSGYCDGPNCWKLEGTIVNDLCILANQKIDLPEAQVQLVDIQYQIDMPVNERLLEIHKQITQNYQAFIIGALFASALIILSMLVGNFVFYLMQKRD